MRFGFKGTKTGILVSYFQSNDKIGPLLSWLEYVEKTHPIDYVDGVVKDLVAYGGHRIEINYWLQEIGFNYFWVAKGDKQRALVLVKMLKSIDPQNPNVDHALSNIQKGIR